MTDVTQHDIVAAIRSLGVTPGDLLIAHTSLSSFGHVAGGARTVAEALIESVSPEGTAFVPTFNYGSLPYDPKTTPSLTGAVTDAFWRLPGAVRSAHPTHAFAGFGPAAAEVLEGHDKVPTLGRGSPLWRLWERNAWVLLAGCDHRANSMIHVAEEAAEAPYLDRTRVAHVLGSGNKVTDVTVRRPGCSSAFNIVDGPLRRANNVREGKAGRSRLTLVRSAAVVAVAMELLRRDSAALLCIRPDCDRCAWARQRISERNSERSSSRSD